MENRKFSYRILNPITEGKNHYRFKSEGINSSPLYGNLSKHRNCKLYSKDGVLRCWIKNGWIFSSDGYAWNGSSPKRFIGTMFFGRPIGIWVGTPDPEGSREASFWHDNLWQFAEVLETTLHDCNYHFLAVMQKNKFSGACAYYNAVEKCGAPFYRKDPDGVYAVYED